MSNLNYIWLAAFIGLGIIISLNIFRISFSFLSYNTNSYWSNFSYALRSKCRPIYNLLKFIIDSWFAFILLLIIGCVLIFDFYHNGIIVTTLYSILYKLCILVFIINITIAKLYNRTTYRNLADDTLYFFKYIFDSVKEYYSNKKHIFLREIAKVGLLVIFIHILFSLVFYLFPHMSLPTDYLMSINSSFSIDSGAIENFVNNCFNSYFNFITYADTGSVYLPSGLDLSNSDILCMDGIDGDSSQPIAGSDTISSNVTSDAPISSNATSDASISSNVDVSVSSNVTTDNTATSGPSNNIDSTDNVASSTNAQGNWRRDQIIARLVELNNDLGKLQYLIEENEGWMSDCTEEEVEDLKGQVEEIKEVIERTEYMIAELEMELAEIDDKWYSSESSVDSDSDN